MSKDDSPKIPASFYLWVIAILAITAGMFFISKHVKYEEKTLTITSAFIMEPTWRIPREVIVEKGASLQFSIGSVLLEGDTTIRVHGELAWPTETLDRVRFAPKDDSKNCRLKIEFVGDGIVSYASFEGYTGPIGEPRLELSIVAKGFLKIENTLFDGVTCSEGSSVLYGEKGVEIKQSRYEGDNRKLRGDRSVAATVSNGAINVYALTLNRLNGFQNLFVCNKLTATNLSISSVQAGRLASDDLQDAIFDAFLLSYSSFDSPISAESTMTFDRSVIQSNEDLLQIKSRSLSFTNSVVWGKSLFLECEVAVCKGSVFSSSGSRIVIGESINDTGHYVGGQGKLRAAFCAFSLVTPSDSLLKRFVSGTHSGEEAPETDENPRSYYRCMVVSEKSGNFDSNGSWRESLLLSQYPPNAVTDGLAWVKLDDGKVPNEVESLSFDNTMLATIYSQAFQAGFLK